MQLRSMDFDETSDKHKSALVERIHLVERLDSQVSKSDSQVQTTINNQQCDLLKKNKTLKQTIPFLVITEDSTVNTCGT